MVNSGSNTQYFGGAVLLAYSLLSGGEREKRVSLETAIPECWLLWELPSGVACGEFAQLL